MYPLQTISRESSTSSFTKGLKTFASGAFKVIREPGIILLAIGFAVAAVALSVIGPLGSLGCLFAAAYHGCSLNYHSRHSREKDSQGHFIQGTELNGATDVKKDYMCKTAQFTQQDLPRLKHELQRLRHQDAMFSYLKWARGLAKCAIPVAGTIWAIKSEVDGAGGSAEGCRCCPDELDHESPEGYLIRYIRNLEPSFKG
ncbi:MAG: hypothetical protein K0S07_291 [Chlamydiales bacterium]|jgi:hypothetical protein|nr:hypothetical protein [Chlamydiales bacterium]